MPLACANPGTVRQPEKPPTALRIRDRLASRSQRWRLSSISIPIPINERRPDGVRSQSLATETGTPISTAGESNRSFGPCSRKGGTS